MGYEAETLSKLPVLDDVNVDKVLCSPLEFLLQKVCSDEKMAVDYQGLFFREFFFSLPFIES
jgi:hypothetical protein